MTARRLGVLGGTFDPVHVGHLDAADAARRALQLDEVRFIPTSHPPHRDVRPLTSPFHRFALLALALQGRPECRVSDLELTRTGVSYTADTLRALHDQGWTASQIFFILGTDAFAEIATWREFPAVLDGAHFVVIARPGTTLELSAARTPGLAGRTVRGEPGWTPGGRTAILLVEAHTRNVSSTLIRRRLADGQPIGDLVPAAVAAHIDHHQLYRAVEELHGH